MGYYYYLGAVYGGDSYGDNAYNSSQTTGTGASGSGQSGNLANTGVLLLTIVTLACFLVFLALLVRFWHRKIRQNRLMQLVPEIIQPDAVSEESTVD